MNTFFIGEYADFVFGYTEELTSNQIKFFNIIESQPAKVISNLEPFANLENTSLIISVSGSGTETVLFDKNYQSAIEVVNYINSTIDPNFDFKAIEKSGRIEIQSLNKGSESNIIVTSNSSLGVVAGTYFGEDLIKNDNVSEFEFEYLPDGLYAVSIYMDEDFFVPNETYFMMVILSSGKIIKEFKVIKKQNLASVNFVS
jgi:hypothetical protein